MTARIAYYNALPSDPYYSSDPYAAGSVDNAAVTAQLAAQDARLEVQKSLAQVATDFAAANPSAGALTWGAPVLDSQVQYRGSQVKQPGGDWQDIAVPFAHPSTESLIGDMFPAPTLDNADLSGGTGGAQMPYPDAAPNRFPGFDVNKSTASDVPNATTGQAGNPVDFGHSLAAIFTPSPVGGSGGTGGSGSGSGASGSGSSGSGDPGTSTQDSGNSTINRLLDLVSQQYSGAGGAGSGGVVALPTEVASSSAAPASSGSAKIFLVVGIAGIAFWWYKNHKKKAA